MPFLHISEVYTTSRFAREYKKADPTLVSAIDEDLRDLLKDPTPENRRFHKLNGYKPAIYKIDVLPDRSWQITFHLSDGKATLRRVANHKQMDRSP